MKSAAVLGLLLLGCSSGSSSPPALPGPEQLPGAACDPSLQRPCEAEKDICRYMSCDPESRTCRSYYFDASGSPSCGGNTDLDAGGGPGAD